MPGPRVRLRPLARDLEPRLHAVQPGRVGEDDAPAQALDRHGHGPRAHGRRDAGQAVQLRHRPPAAAHRARRAARVEALRRGGRARRLDAGHRRPCARGHLPHHRRRDAVERVARLRAAPDHAPGHAPRPHARARAALPLGGDVDRGRDPGRRVPGDRRGPRARRRCREAGGGALQRDARPRHGQDPRVPRGARERPAKSRRREVSLHALRHARLPDRSRAGGLPGRRLVRAAGGDEAVRDRDGGPARARAGGRGSFGSRRPPTATARSKSTASSRRRSPSPSSSATRSWRRPRGSWPWSARGGGCPRRGRARSSRSSSTARPPTPSRAARWAIPASSWGREGQGRHRGHVLPRRPSDRPPRPRHPGEAEGERRGGGIRRVRPGGWGCDSTTRAPTCSTRRSGGSSAPT